MLAQQLGQLELKSRPFPDFEEVRLGAASAAPYKGFIKGSSMKFIILVRGEHVHCDICDYVQYVGYIIIPFRSM